MGCTCTSKHAEARKRNQSSLPARLRRSRRCGQTNGPTISRSAVESQSACGVAAFLHQKRHSFTRNGIPSPEVDKRPLVIGPVHLIRVASERNHAQRVVLFRTRRPRHHRLTPVFMPGFAHHQLAELFPQLRLPAIQGSGEIVMRRPCAANFQLTNTPELSDTLLPASHSSLRHSRHSIELT